MARHFHRIRFFLFGVLALSLAACAAAPKPEVVVAPAPMGDFKLGFAVAVADKVQKGPLSREVTQNVLVNAMKSELDRVFSPFEGSKFYNLGVSVDAYVLAVPGLPIVASPSSALVVTLSVWDDAKQKMILAEPKQFTVLEKLSGKSIFGSGLTQTKEQQLASLIHSAVKQIEAYLRENESLFQNATPPVTKS